MGVFLAGFRSEVQRVRVQPIEFILTIVLMPLFYTVAVLMLAQSAGRLSSLGVYGIVGPAVLGIWAGAVMASGELIEGERGHGTLELMVATPPGAFEISLLGRIAANTVLSLFALVESALVAWFLFGVSLNITDPVVFAMGLVVLLVSTAGCGLIMANVFILSRSVRIFQNALTFPFYLLGGLTFPVAALPAWLHPLSYGIALSWGSDLLRTGAGQASGFPAALSVTCGLALAIVYFAIGHALFMWTERRVRRDASLGSY
jgi:ABC-2 type transport system permease protein